MFWWGKIKAGSSKDTLPLQEFINYWPVEADDLIHLNTSWDLYGLKTKTDRLREICQGSDCLDITNLSYEIGCLLFIILLCLKIC